MGVAGVPVKRPHWNPARSQMFLSVPDRIAD